MRKERRLDMGHSKIFAIDFDGTIVEDRFPEIGQLKPHAIRIMKRLQVAGNKIILWTCRPNIYGEREYLHEAIKFLWEQGFDPDAVNENIDKETKLGIPKVLADYYLDDKNFPPFDDWLEFEQEMIWEGILTDPTDE